MPPAPDRPSGFAAPDVSDPFTAINNTPLAVEAMRADWETSDAGGALMDKWGAEFEQNAVDAQYTAADALAAMPAKFRDPAIALFDRLPATMQFAVIEGLAGIGARLR